MKSYRESITAGQPLAQHLGGRIFYIQRCDAGGVLTVELINGTTVQRIDNVGKGFKAAPVDGFKAFRITAAVNCVVDFVIADGDIDVQFDSETRISNDNTTAIPVRTVAGQPLEVLFGGTVAPVVGTINNTDAQALPVVQKIGTTFSTQEKALTVVTNIAPVVVGLAQVALSNDATLKRLRIRNSHATAVVAIGATGVTLVNGAIQLQPGDVWEERDAAGAAWFAISDTAATTLQLQGIK